MNNSVAFIQALVAAARCGNLALAQTSSGFGRPTDQPAPGTDRNPQIAHEQLVGKAKKGGIDVCSLGDSITRHWGESDFLKITVERAYEQLTQHLRLEILAKG